MSTNTSQSVAVHVSGDDHSDALSIVFLHGMGASSWMWKAQIEMLSKDFHCLVVDLPGHGESADMRCHTFKEMGPLIAEVIRGKAHEGKAHMVGLSLGGFVTLHMLADFPELIHSAVVSGVVTKPMANRWLLPPMAKLITLMMYQDWMLNRMIGLLGLPAEDVQWGAPLMRKDIQRLAPATAERNYQELMSFDLDNLFHGRDIEARLLAVAGEKEAAPIVNGLTGFRNLQPASNRSVFKAPNAHHGWNIEFPQLFNDMLWAWVENKPVPRELIAVD